MSDRISNLATSRTAEEVVTFDMRQLNDGLRMGRITSWSQFASLWNTVMSSIRFAMVNTFRTESERADLVSLLQELQARFQRMVILNSSTGMPEMIEGCHGAMPSVYLYAMGIYNQELLLLGCTAMVPVGICTAL